MIKGKDRNTSSALVCPHCSEWIFLTAETWLIKSTKDRKKKVRK